MEKSVNKKHIDMLNGPIWNKLPLFALPVAATAILEQLFNASDLAIVGNFTGADKTLAVAAVGANSSIIALIVNLFVGIALGANVVIANAIGRDDSDSVQKAVHTSVMVSVIGGVPMGIGIFLVWPLAKRFGKRNVTMWGFVLYAIGSAICWMFPTNLYIVLVGQFIKNIGGLPCAYVFMALFADSLDHIEWKSGVRCDGLAMSISSIISVALVGVCTGIFNALIAQAGYVAPSLNELGQTIAAVQNDAVKNVITFSFVGLEVFTGAALAILLAFFNVEKTLGKKQQIIRDRQKAECEARGEEWIAPEIKAAQDEEKFILENEQAFVENLKVKCEKKGLDFEQELEKHNKQVAEKKAKAEEKKRLAEEKKAARVARAEQKQAQRLAKLTPEQLAKREECLKNKAEREEKAWEIEKQKGEEYYQKIQAELNR